MRFSGPNEWEGLRQSLEELSDKEPEPGGWRIEARLVHNPVPWESGLISPNVSVFSPFGSAASELQLLELGYRVAWRMDCETTGGYTRRYMEAMRTRCEVSGHVMRDYPPSSFSGKYKFTMKCRNCGHTNGPYCHCHSCGGRNPWPERD